MINKRMRERGRRNLANTTVTQIILWFKEFLQPLNRL